MADLFALGGLLLVAGLATYWFTDGFRDPAERWAEAECVAAWNVQPPTDTVDADVVFLRAVPSDAEFGPSGSCSIVWGAEAGECHEMDTTLETIDWNRTTCAQSDLWGTEVAVLGGSRLDSSEVGLPD